MEIAAKEFLTAVLRAELLTAWRAFSFALNGRPGIQDVVAGPVEPRTYFGTFLVAALAFLLAMFAQSYTSASGSFY